MTDSTFERTWWCDKCDGITDHLTSGHPTNLPARRRYPLEGWIVGAAADHYPDAERGGCSCGFGAWSPEHVAVMAYRDAVDRNGEAS